MLPSRIVNGFMFQMYFHLTSRRLSDDTQNYHTNTKILVHDNYQPSTQHHHHHQRCFTTVITGTPFQCHAPSPCGNIPNHKIYFRRRNGSELCMAGNKTLFAMHWPPTRMPLRDTLYCANRSPQTKTALRTF